MRSNIERVNYLSAGELCDMLMYIIIQSLEIYSFIYSILKEINTFIQQGCIKRQNFTKYFFLIKTFHNKNISFHKNMKQHRCFQH